MLVFQAMLMQFSVFKIFLVFTREKTKKLWHLLEISVYWNDNKNPLTPISVLFST